MVRLASHPNSSKAGGCLGQIRSRRWVDSCFSSLAQALQIRPIYIFFICSYFDEASFRIIIYFEHVLTVIQNRIVWQSGNDFEKREHKKLLERKPDHRMDSEAAGIDTTLRQWRTVANGGCEEVTEGGLGAKGKGDSNVLSSGVRSSVCSAKKPCDTGGARCPGLGACSTQAFIHLSRNQASWILVSKPGRNIQGEKKKAAWIYRKSKSLCVGMFGSSVRKAEWQICVPHY